MATATIDYSALADQARTGAIDYAALADQARGNSPIAPQESKPSIVSDALKYSPVGMVKGLADMIRTAASGHNPLAGMAEANAKILDKAKESFDKGHYAEAAGHFLNYLAPGGSAMEDISHDIQNGNYGHAAAKFTGLASNIPLGAKAPAILDAATEPELGGNIAAGAARAGNAVKAGARAAAGDVAAGGAKIAAGVVLPKIPGLSYGLEFKGGTQVLRGLSGGVKAARAALSERVATAAARAATEAADPLANAVAQSLGHEDFSSAPSEAQAVARNLVESIRNAPVMTPEQVAAFTGEAPEAPVSEAAPSPPAGQVNPEPTPPQASASSPAASSPDARLSISPELATRVDEIQAATHPPEQRLSLAEQLRDAMLQNGTITQEHLAPPELPSESVTPEGQAALADTMREAPNGARLPIARATYAGGGVDDSELAGAVYEAAHRADRAGKLANLLNSHGVSSEEIPHIAPEHWEAMAKSLKMNPPSAKTIAETAAQLHQIEHRAAALDALNRLKESLAKPKAEAAKAAN